MVLDDLSGGRRAAVPAGVELVQADAGDRRAMAALDAPAAVERAAGTAIAVRAGPGRPGDIAVAAPERTAHLPGWRARHGLDAVVSSALARAGAPVLAEGGSPGRSAGP